MFRPPPGDPSLKLKSHEECWRDHYDWLLSKGYELRPRYRPSWTSSWEASGHPYLLCEDHVHTYVSHRQFFFEMCVSDLPIECEDTLDAKRLSDGKQVYLKRVLQWSGEAAIMKLFSSDERKNDPRNHCVPLLDTLVDDDHCFLVMPQLGNFFSPDFKSVDETLEFVRQTLEVSVV